MATSEPPAGMDPEEWKTLQASQREPESYETTAAIVVKTYADHDQFEREANEMIGYGWQVQTVTEGRPRAGLLRILTLGLFSLVFPPKPTLTVTYTRAPEDDQPRRRRRR